MNHLLDGIKIKQSYFDIYILLIIQQIILCSEYLEWRSCHETSKLVFVKFWTYSSSMKSRLRIQNDCMVLYDENPRFYRESQVSPVLSLVFELRYLNAEHNAALGYGPLVWYRSRPYR